jgi:hypothetical protein
MTCSRSLQAIRSGYVKMKYNSAVSSHLKLLTRFGFGPWRIIRGQILADKDFSFKILSDNRQAGHNYFLLERFEAGMALTGTEVKAAKDGKIQLKDAYALVQDNEAWLMNAHISAYSHGNREKPPAHPEPQAAVAPPRNRQAAG